MPRYALEIKHTLDRKLAKLARRDRPLLRAVWKKVTRLRDDPQLGKPLRAPMQRLRRVHLQGSFVLIYTVDDSLRIITLLDLEHHDKVYRRG